MVLFLSRDDYDKIEELAANLDRMKIEIETEVKELKYDTTIYYEALGQVEIEKTEGKTYSEK